MSIWTKAFWRAAGERAMKSAVQGAIAAGIGVGFDALHANWQTIGGAALSMAILSVLTSVASDGLSGGAGPSLGGAEVVGQTVAVTAPKDAAVTTTTEATFGAVPPPPPPPTGDRRPYEEPN